MTVTTNGRKAKIERLFEEFQAEGVTFPSKEPTWAGGCFVNEKPDPATPKTKKQKTEDGKSAKNSSGYASSPSGAVLNEALRKRLAAKMEKKA